MCGIAGYLNFDGRPAEEQVVERMCEAIIHRGPDGQRVYVDGAIGLGHRRLSVLDLSEAAAQPMVSEDQRFVLSYNGELYNYVSLREELKKRGYAFRSTGDTEVVLNAWREWGTGALDRFNGMFAFAIWDTRERRLILARDRYGVKPLYYTRTGEGFLFGSEVKALLAHGGYRSQLDREALLEYFTFQNFFTDRTLWEELRILPAGCWVEVNLRGHGEPMYPVQRYWDFEFKTSESVGSREECVEELDRLLEQAVKLQLASDVEVGAYLSGGIDSGAITALAARCLPFMRSFTVGFDLQSASGVELAYDERAKAEHMSYLFHTEHYEMVLKAGDMERCIRDLVYHMEEPRVGQSYPNFYASKLASKFNKVVLSGAGGDEMFGGYPWRYYRSSGSVSFEGFVDDYFSSWQRLLSTDELRRVFAPMSKSIGSQRGIAREVLERSGVDAVSGPEDSINRSLYFEAKTFLHGLLVMEDKLSMSHGLESRVPFLDNDLVDFAMRVPVRYKLGNLGRTPRIDENESGVKTQKYFERTHDGKLLLREALSKHVPDSVRDGVKQGFSAPDASWFKGDSIEYVKRRICGSDARIFEYMDRAAVRELVGRHLEGRENKRLLIWSLLYFEQWLDEFL